ncbi:Hypothetical protein D9617_1g087330 [Elsinoe fawcettii]|nr:Hypothetical protein D9617_1g087330 [Elsinoe fawcettii]
MAPTTAASNNQPLGKKARKRARMLKEQQEQAVNAAQAAAKPPQVMIKKEKKAAKKNFSEVPGPRGTQNGSGKKRSRSSSSELPGFGTMQQSSSKQKQPVSKPLTIATTAPSTVHNQPSTTHNHSLSTFNPPDAPFSCTTTINVAPSGSNKRKFPFPSTCPNDPDTAETTTNPIRAVLANKKFCAAASLSYPLDFSLRVSPTIDKQVMTLDSDHDVRMANYDSPVPRSAAGMGVRDALYDVNKNLFALNRNFADLNANLGRLARVLGRVRAGETTGVDGGIERAEALGRDVVGEGGEDTRIEDGSGKGYVGEGEDEERYGSGGNGDGEREVSEEL